MLDVSITPSDNQNVKILTLSGELDLHEKELVMSLFPQLLSNRPKAVIVDLTRVTLLASAGIEALIYLQQELKGAGGHMVAVFDHNDYIIRKLMKLGIFEGTGIEGFETVAEAEKSLSK